MNAENCDLAIIGTGTTGMSAAIAAYCKNPDLKIKLIGIPFDSNTAKKGEIENIPGITKAVGVDFVQQVVEQLQGFNKEFNQDSPVFEFVNENATSINKIDLLFEIITESQSFSAKTIIVATGIPELGGTIKGEEAFLHKGVSHCAVCDGALFRGRKAAVIGNGNIVARGALFLRKFCRKITIFCPSNDLKCDKRYLKKISSTENIKIKYAVDLDTIEIFGAQVVQGIKYQEEGEEKQLSTDVVFIELKDKPNLSYLHELNLNITTEGLIETDASNATNIPGLFAAGTAKGELDYIPVLMGDGYKAGIYAVEYIEREG